MGLAPVAVPLAVPVHDICGYLSSRHSIPTICEISNNWNSNPHDLQDFRVIGRRYTFDLLYKTLRASSGFGFANLRTTAAGTKPRKSQDFEIVGMPAAVRL